MQRPTRIATAVGGVIAAVLLLLFLVPALLGGRIADRVKTEANRALAARVDWSDAGLGLFRNFPSLTLSLDDLSVVGIERFEGDTLAAIGSLRVVLDLPSAIGAALGGGPVVVRAVDLDRPRLALVVLEDGTANWNITRADPADTAAGRAIDVSLRRLAITGGRVTFDNRAAGLRAALAGLGGTLRGDFAAQRFDIATRAVADTATLEFGGITYLDRVRLELAADIDADRERGSFAVGEGTALRLNELALAASGTVVTADDRMTLDLDFSSPATSFRDILSLVPAVYAHDFESVRTSGSVAVSGTVDGDYGENAFPAFSLLARVDSGAFQYPDLPLPARDIFLDLAVRNPGGDADSTVVDLRRFHVVFGRNPVNARMVMRTPVSDPDVDAAVTGRLDLADLRRTVKLEGMNELAGVIAADASVRTRLSWIDEGRFDRVAASGTVTARDVAVSSEGLRQPLAVREASLRLAPRRAELLSLSGTAGGSDFAATGWLDNALGYLLRDEDLRGSATITSRRVLLDEWRSEESGLTVIPVPPGIDFTLDATVGELVFDDLRMTDARGRVRVKDERLTLERFALNTLGGSIVVDGFYETTVPATPTFDVGLRMYELDIPSAFTSLATVRALAPVARYAQGRFSTDLRLSGPLGGDMVPLFQALTGRGSLQTTQLQIRDFPLFERLAGSTKLSFLDDPALRAISSQFEIRDGRLHVQPFTAAVGEATMTVAGSNGLDQSLDYDLRMAVPRGLVDAAAAGALTGLVSRAAGAGLDLGAAAEVTLGVDVTGTVTDPALRLDVGTGAGGAVAGAAQAVRDTAADRAQALADSVRGRADAERARLVAEAEARAEEIRAEGRALAERITREGHTRADSLAARPGSALEQAAARAAAARLRAETDANAARVVREADERADAVVSQARQSLQ